jgi:tetrahydromethanopterin S-methyltransferase subunit G
MQDPSRVNQDFVLDFLVSNILRASSDNKVSEGIILKILFELKKSLDPGNPIGLLLPFYWYFHGPYSDVLANQIHKMESKDILEKQFLPKHRWAIYHLKNEVEYKEEYGLDEALARLQDILRTVDFTKTSEYRESIYRRYAPFHFMNTFKVDFCDRLEYLNDKIEQNLFFQNNELDTVIDKEIHQLIDLLYKSEIELSYHPIFELFQEYFSSYVTGAIRILENNSEESNSSRFYVKKEALERSTKECWQTFAHGVRIPDEGHDPYYNTEVPRWTVMYKKSIDNYKNIIEGFYSQSINYIDFEKLASHPFDDQSRSILSSSLGGYLGFGE